MSLFQRTFHRLQPSMPRHASQRIRGLDEFFEKSIKTSIPVEEIPAGRAWSPSELRKKSFDDLHKLWYVLLKERNMLATQRGEAERIKVRFLHKERFDKVHGTMSRIMTILNERQLAYQQAHLEYQQSKKNNNSNNSDPDPVPNSKDSERSVPSLNDSENNRLHEELNELRTLTQSVQMPKVPPIEALRKQVDKKRQELDEKEKKASVL